MKDFVYLSGAMDAAPDYGIGWRKKMQTFFEKLEISCFNPCREEEIFLGFSRKELVKLRRDDLNCYINQIRKLMDRDLEIIRTRTRFLVAYLDKHVRAGTYGEMIFAYSQGVDVFVISALDEKSIPGWVLACATKIFSSIKECMDFFENKYSGAK